MKLAPLTLAMLLLAGSAAQAFDGNDRILDVDQYQKLPPNPPYDAPVAFGYVAPAAVVRRFDDVPYGSQVTRTEYGVAPTYGYIGQPSYGYRALPNDVVPPTCGCLAQPTTDYVAQPSYVVPPPYGYVAPPTYGDVETRTYGYTSVPRVYEPRR